jgi:uncharacterized heparinase superfamily protein
MSLKYFLEKSLSYPPKIILKKVFSKGFALSRDYFWYINDYIFNKELSDDDLYNKLFKNIKKINIDFHWQTFLEDKAKDKIIKEADKSKNHIFDLLGSGDGRVDYKLKAKGLEGYRYDMRISEKERLLSKEKIQSELEKIFQKSIEYEPIDWQVDFKSGYRWSEKNYYKFIKYGHKFGVDVKVPWELSRAQHLIQLALAYRSTKKEEYAEEIIKQLVDWILTNRYRFGVNWRCTMDVAIRVTNWVLAINLIENYISNLPSAGKEYFYKVFYKNLYQHGDFIIHNLEWSQDLTSNHYLSDIAGLLILAVFTENIFKEAGEWKEFAIKELKKEMFKQIYPDGTDFEASTCYHRLVLELFFYSTFFVAQNVKYKAENEKKDLLSSADDYKTIAEEIYGKDYIARLYKMFEAVLYLLKPNGRMPQIGDNDNGQFIKLYPREVLDMRNLLALGAVFFRESKWKIKEFFESDESIAEVMILYGKKGMEIWNSLEWDSFKNIKSKAFTDSGWYVMRNNKDYCIISCGPNGQNGRGGHCHNDKLSFELCIDGEDIIVDPGTYVYTPLPEWRNKFRSTAYHNTVIIDGKEQNKILDTSLFEMENDAKNNIKCIKWESKNEYDLFIGEYLKYTDSNIQIVHRRIINFDKKFSKIKVDDIVKNLKEQKSISRHRLEWLSILNPGISLRAVENDKYANLLEVAINDNEKLKIFIKNNSLSKIKLNISEKEFSNYYGIRQMTKAINGTHIFSVPFQTTFYIIKEK